MQFRRHFLPGVLLAAFLGCISLPAFADDPCAGFKWDITQERALFAGPATSVTIGKTAPGAPALQPDRLYRLQLTPQDQVTFAALSGI